MKESQKREGHDFRFDLIKLILMPLVIAVIGFFATIWTNQNQLKVAKLREVKNLIAKLHASQEDPQFTRTAAAIALSEYGELAVPALVASVLEGNSKVQMAAVRSLQRIAPRHYPELESVLLSDPHAMRRRNAAIALGLLGPAGAEKILIQALRQETEPFVRACCLVALTRVRGSAKDLDVRKIDLHGVDMRVVNFDSSFSRIDLSGADFSGANLSASNFAKCKLGHAVLKAVDLRDANLQVADLKYAMFDSAKVEGCDFKFADLEGANFQGADFGAGKGREKTLKTILFSRHWQTAHFDSAVEDELVALTQH